MEVVVPFSVLMGMMSYYWSIAAEDGGCSLVLVPVNMEDDDWSVMLTFAIHQ